MTKDSRRGLLDIPFALAGSIAAVPAAAVRGVAPLAALPQNAITLLDAASALLSRLATLLDRVDSLLEASEPTLRRLGPFLDELAGSLTRDHARAVVQGLDMLPEVEAMALPAMRNVVGLIPELDLVLERLDSIFNIIEGMPGAQRFKRRAEAALDTR